MDESNDCADEPTILNISSSEPIASREYVSRCKVLVVGIGADEQLGGYGRHRTAFRRGKESKAESMLPSDRSDQAVDDEMTPLEMELNKDLERLWKRNLGRYGLALKLQNPNFTFKFLN
jgi:asparagine synthetase B (glutamine-hydrolysing)